MGGDAEARGYVIRGRVQRVGFRWFVQRMGVRHCVAGHVRNLSDGAVEVHARGGAEALRAFEAALREGPPAARVEAVVRIPADPRTPATGFLVERW